MMTRDSSQSPRSRRFQQTDTKLKVVVFSGGRGTATICAALLLHPQIELTVLLNAYDDGLSTGRVRALVPGLLGPSDIRKCCARLMPETDRSDRALRTLIEHRLPTPTTREDGLAYLDAIVNAGRPDVASTPLMDELRVDQARRVATAIERVKQHIETDGRDFDFGDCSIGNLILAGFYLASNGSFNDATSAFSTLVGSRGRVLNVTGGENLVLVGTKTDGTYLADEAAIVSPQSVARLRDVYLLPAYLTAEERADLAHLSPDEVHDELRRREVFPSLNPECKTALATADIIVYGPGTQHSSLFPSYLTQGLGEVIAENAHAEKIFVANIRRDHEIQSETAESLVAKLRYYMTRKGKVQIEKKELVSSVFVQSQGTSDHLPTDVRPDFGGANVVRSDWETHGGEHLGGRVAAEIVSIAAYRIQRDIEPFHYMVSIVVPGLDEAKTVGKVLDQLALLDFAHFGLGKEIIYVDGGSTDGSLEIASRVRNVRIERSSGGRGNAMRKGIEAAQGNIIVFFPSDGEYDPNDTLRLVEPIVAGQSRAVFGIRPIARVGNYSDHMHAIYGSDRMGYLLGKYGGLTLSMLGLLLLNRYVSDYLSSVKAFDARLLRDLQMSATGVEFETELVAKLSRKNEMIIELPANFRARSRSEGKKTTMLDGLRAIATLIRYGVTQ